MELDSVHEHAQVQVKKKLPNVLLNTTLGIQIFRNLLDNAIKYNDKKQCLITINYRQLKNQIEISISDNGPGIDLEHCQQIFKIFEQGSSKLTKGSLGIGLATVKNIVDVVGGSIRVESEPGNGANFILTLKQTV
jgi:signal transduction histidine kinase